MMAGITKCRKLMQSIHYGGQWRRNLSTIGCVVYNIRSKNWVCKRWTFITSALKSGCAFPVPLHFASMPSVTYIWNSSDSDVSTFSLHSNDASEPTFWWAELSFLPSEPSRAFRFSKASLDEPNIFLNNDLFYTKISLYLQHFREYILNSGMALS